MHITTPLAPIQFANGITIELVQSSTGDFIGLGAISAGGVALRKAARPLSIRLDTPDGILYPRLGVTGVTRSDDGVCVALSATGISWGRGEYCDEYDQPLIELGQPVEPVEDRLTLILTPVSRTLGGRIWEGFSYAFHFQSDTRSIHRLLTLGTWEIGGTITGNTVLHQGQCNMPVYRGAIETVFTTTCLKTLNQYGSKQGVSYQLAPRGGLLQAFDFQYAAQGALLQYWPCFESISSVVESPAGADVLQVVDEYRFPLAKDVVTTPKWVLFTPGALAEHEARDLWWDAYEDINGGIRAAHGVTPTPVIPEAGQGYYTRIDDDGLKVYVVGEMVDHQEMLYAVADRLLPKMAAQGIRRFFPEVCSESDVTVLGMQRKLDGGVHGDLLCSSVCGTHRFQPAEFWGGMPAWHYLAEKSRALGIEIGAWFAPHFSPRAQIYQDHPEYRLIAANSLPNGGGYGHQSIVTANWNTGIFDWVLNDIRRWQEEGGLDYLFTDSWANLGLVQVDFARGMETNLHRLGQLYHEFQKLGIKAFTFEGISPFGASRFGLADLRGDLLDAQGGVVGQNDFGWWVGEEDMAFGLCLCAHPRKRTEEELERIQFRAMANRSYGMFSAPYLLDFDLPDWWRRLHAIHRQALPHMHTRRLLPDRAGVRWLDGAVQTVWAYQDIVLPVTREAVIELLETDGPQLIDHADTLTAQAGQVYRIQG